MDISSRFSPYGRLALNKSLINKDEEKNKEQSPELNKENDVAEKSDKVITVGTDALTLLAMQNKGLMNVQTPAATNTPSVSNAPAANSGSDFVDQLFQGQETIDAKFLTENYKTWQNSSNPKLRELYNAVTQKMNDLGFDEAYNKLQPTGKGKLIDYNVKEFFNSLIKLLNNTIQLGTNLGSNSNTLKIDDLLDQNNLLDTIEQIFNSPEFENEYYFGSIDGEIGSYAQGERPNWNGSCTFFANINSLNSSDSGKALIKDAITIETLPNGEIAYRVTLKNIGLSTLVTKAEIIEGKKAGYALGDTDALIFETALIKIQQEHNTQTNEIAPLMSDNYLNITNLFSKNQEKAFNIIYDAFKNGDVVLTFGRNGHACSIVDINIDKNNSANSTITVVDPYHSDEQITYSLSEFLANNYPIYGYQIFDSFDIDNALLDVSDMNSSYDLSNLIMNFTSDSTQGLYFNGGTFVYSEEKLSALKDKIMSKVLLKYQMGVIDDYLFYGIRKVLVSDYNTDNNHGTFTYNNHSYTFSLTQNSNSQCMLADEILSYTKNSSIINKYFEVSATMDGQPLAYRLKYGMSFEDFKKEANKNRWQYNHDFHGTAHKVGNEAAVQSEIKKDLIKNLDKSKTAQSANDLRLR